MDYVIASFNPSARRGKYGNDIKLANLMGNSHLRSALMGTADSATHSIYVIYNNTALHDALINIKISIYIPLIT